MPKKLTRKICDDILSDEPSAAKLYNDLGFHKQGKQEAEHYKFFKRKCANVK